MFGCSTQLRDWLRQRMKRFHSTGLAISGTVAVGAQGRLALVLGSSHAINLYLTYIP
jgi:hypothetical protein